MSNNVDYYSKYLKYKNKYLDLKNQLEGGSVPKAAPKAAAPAAHAAPKAAAHATPKAAAHAAPKAPAAHAAPKAPAHAAPKAAAHAAGVLSESDFYAKAYSALMSKVGASHCSVYPGTQTSINNFNKKIIKDEEKNLRASNLKKSAAHYGATIKTFGDIYNKHKDTGLKCTGGIHMPSISMPSMPNVSSTDVANAISSVITGTM